MTSFREELDVRLEANAEVFEGFRELDSSRHDLAKIDETASGMLEEHQRAVANLAIIRSVVETLPSATDIPDALMARQVQRHALGVRFGRGLGWILGIETINSRRMGLLIGVSETGDEDHFTLTVWEATRRSWARTRKGLDSNEDAFTPAAVAAMFDPVSSKYSVDNHPDTIEPYFDFLTGTGTYGLMNRFLSEHRPGSLIVKRQAHKVVDDIATKEDGYMVQRAVRTMKVADHVAQIATDLGMEEPMLYALRDNIIN